MSKCDGILFSGVVVVAISDVVYSASSAGADGLCFRSEVLGHREGNLYHCTDPALPVCCEQDNTHTCCQQEAEKNMNDQAILWGLVGLTIVCLALIYYHFTREGDYWEADTVKQAAGRMARRFGMTAFSKTQEDRTPMSRDFDNVQSGSSNRECDLRRPYTAPCFIFDTSIPDKPSTNADLINSDDLDACNSGNDLDACNSGNDLDACNSGNDLDACNAGNDPDTCNSGNDTPTTRGDTGSHNGADGGGPDVNDMPKYSPEIDCTLPNAVDKPGTSIQG